METLKELLNETSFHILSYHQGIVKEIKSKKIVIEINPYCLVRDDSQLFEKVFWSTLYGRGDDPLPDILFLVNKNNLVFRN